MVRRRISRRALSFALMMFIFSFSVSGNTFAFKTQFFKMLGKPIHWEILKEALSPLGFQEEILNKLREGCDSQDWPASPKFTKSPDHHFDDNNIQQGYEYIKKQLNYAVIKAESADKNAKDRDTVLYTLGETFHTLQDFYSHSNYAEWLLRNNRPIVIMDWQNIPAQIRSGYFYYHWELDNETFSISRASAAYKLRKELLKHQPGIIFHTQKEFQDRDNNPTYNNALDYVLGEKELLHYELNKDEPGSFQGKIIAPSVGKTFHEIARELAIKDTARHWKLFCSQLREEYGERSSAIIANLKGRPLRLVIDSAGVQPPEAKSGEKLKLVIEYSVQGLSEDDLLAVYRTIDVSGPQPLGPFNDRRLAPNTRERAEWPIAVEKPGNYTYTYKIYAPGVAVLNGSVSFKILAEEKIEEPAQEEIQELEANLSVNPLSAKTGEWFDAEVEVKGGQPPYSIEWFLDGKLFSSTAGESFRFNIWKAGRHTVSVKVRDKSSPAQIATAGVNLEVEAKKKEAETTEEIGSKIPEDVSFKKEPPVQIFGSPPISSEAPSLQQEEKGPFCVFLLTNVSYGLYLGTEESLKGKIKCGFEGGGIDCGPNDFVTYEKLLGPFNTQQEAQSALCENISERYVYPLGIGLKGQWQGDDKKWYGLWDDSVTFDCKEIPHKKVEWPKQKAEKKEEKPQPAQAKETKEEWKITIKSVQGEDVEYIRDGKQFPLSPGTELKEGDRIRTGYQSKAVFILPNGDVVTVEELTEFKVGLFRLGPTNEVELWLKAGEVQADVTRHAAIRSSFIIKSTSSVTSVRGTIFSVRVNKDESTDVSVYEGEVIVTQISTGKQIMLNAGQKIHVTNESLGKLVALDREDLARLEPEFRASIAGLELPPEQPPGTSVSGESPNSILNSPSPWNHPRIRELMDTWLKIATPIIQKKKGGSWFYDDWGRAYNNTSIKKPTQRLDTPQDRYEYLWGISSGLASVSHLSLREYVEKALRGETVGGMISREPSIGPPQPPAGTPTGTGVEQAAPGFNTADIFGQRFDLSHLRANVVILFFWSDIHDPVSRSVLASLQKLKQEYAREKVKIVSINLRDNQEDLKKFLQSKGLDFIQLLDSQWTISKSYNLDVLPKIFLLDGRGVIKYVGVGKDVPDSADFQNAVKEAAKEARKFSGSAGESEPRAQAVPSPAQAPSSTQDCSACAYEKCPECAGDMVILCESPNEVCQDCINRNCK